MSDSPLRMESVSHAFGSLAVLRDLTLEVGPGEFVAVVGPSGCGKTTLLHLLSGSFEPTLGTMVRRTRTRMVYQQDGLFPWLTAAENIALGLRHLRDPAERSSQVSDLLELVRLEGFGGYYPHQLSGGMRQRVELARALAGEPALLLLDEPFSALDYQARLRMRRELVRLLEQRPRTVVFVTHDLEEAAQLADRIVVLTERPASIRREIRVDLPRPRTLTHPVVVDTIGKLLSEMGFDRDGDCKM